MLGLPDANTGIGEFNVLNDPYALASGAAKIYKKAYKGEYYEHTYEYDLGIDENKWDTGKQKLIVHASRGEKCLLIKHTFDDQGTESERNNHAVLTWLSENRSEVV